MPHYLFHLRDSIDQLLDPDGVNMAADEVPGAALRAARDCIAGDAMNGRIDLRYRIDVEDEDQRIIHSLPFADAVELIPATT